MGVIISRSQEEKLMIDEVAGILREVAADIVLPRFRNLAADEVEEKAPGDLVTIADRESELVLTRRLTELVPGSLVVGEEAVAADAAVLDRLGEPGPVWLIDPIDGTGNFAAGRQPFALMVALLRDGVPVLSVIHEPVPDTVAAAEVGSGAYVDGVRMVLDDTPVPLDELRGALLTRYLPAELRSQVELRGKRLGEALPGQHCAGREYPDVVRGRQHFALFWRGLPWDHVPGSLLVREAGGVVRHFDGAEYRPMPLRSGLLVCRNAGVFDQLRGALFD
jgi:fructose-1,6-bisphosphatase/inositol monophosphatase family enzyme